MPLLGAGWVRARKDKLAREIGEAVAQKVFTDEDISGIFTSEGMKQTVADGMLFFASGDEKKQSLATLMETYLEKGEQADFCVTWMPPCGRRCSAP